MPVTGPRPPARGGLRVLAWAPLVALLVALALHRLFAFDIWGQIAAGDWIRAHGLPSIDPFSYAFPGRAWIEPRWLWCVLVSAVFDRFGADALIVLKLALLLTAFVALGRAAGARLRATGPAWAGLALAIVGAHERFLVRPELLSFLGLALVLLAVERFRAGGSAAWLVALPPAVAVWANAHTLWILGPAVLWIVVGAEVVQGRAGALWPAAFRRDDAIAGRRLGLLAVSAVASTAAALVNPHGVAGFLFPFRLFREISSGELVDEAISEFRGPLEAPWHGANVAVLLAVGLGSAATFLAVRRRVPLARVGLWCAFAVLALAARRNVALFAIVAGFVAARNLDDGFAAGAIPARLARAGRAAWAAGALAALALVPAVATDRLYRWERSDKEFGLGVSDRRYPRRAEAFLAREGFPGPVLHALQDGGYLMFRRGPGSVFVDGRLEVYDAAALDAALRGIWTADGAEREARRTGARVFLVPHDGRHDAALAALEASPAWVPVYFDALDVAYLLVDDATRGFAERFAIDWSHPRRTDVDPPAETVAAEPFAGAWPRVGAAFDDRRLGSLLAAYGSYDAALGHFERAAARDPGDARVAMFLGLYREAVGRDDEAAALYARVPRDWLERPDTLLLGARLDRWAGRPAEAVARFARAAAAGAPEPGTSIELARAAIVAGEVDRAEQALDAALDRHPDAVDAWNLLAVIAIRRGDRDTAIARFEDSLARRPDQPEVVRALDDLRRGGASDPPPR